MKSLRLWFLFLALLAAAPAALACCAADRVGVYPRRGNIAANSIFIIEFEEGDFKLKDKISSFIFQAKTPNGLPVYLVPLQVNFSGSLGQIVLKPTAPFHLHDSISLLVTVRKDTSLNQEKLRSLISQVEWPKWKVAIPADVTPPRWNTATVTSKTHDHSNSSVGGYSISFNCPVTDNSFATLSMLAWPNDVESIPVFYEITFEGSRYVSATNRFSPAIYTSGCGSNFYFGLNRRYTALIRPLDSAGNYCPESKTAEFVTTPVDHDLPVIHQK